MTTQRFYHDDNGRLKPIYIYVLALIFVMYLVGPLVVLAQKPVRGNGVIVEQVRPLGLFTSIILDFSADVTITGKAMPVLSIKTDENIQQHIRTEIRGNKLHILQDGWNEPSKPVKISVGLPFLTSIETSGYSKVTITKLETQHVTIDVGVGDLTASGEVGEITIKTKTGNIDASALLANKVSVAIESWGTVLVHARQNLTAELESGGTVVYYGSPEKVIRNIAGDGSVIAQSDAVLDEQDSVPVKYVKLKLVNNGRKKANLRVEGPTNKRFGYGFSIRSGYGRSETFPVGSKIFNVSAWGSERLLLTIEADHADKNVNLF